MSISKGSDFEIIKRSYPQLRKKTSLSKAIIMPTLFVEKKINIYLSIYILFGLFN